MKRRTRPEHAPVGLPTQGNVPGMAPGIEIQDLAQLPSTKELPPITCIDFNAENFKMQVVDDLEDFIIQHRPEWLQNSGVRWINVDGISNMDVIRAFAEKYDLHPLAIEDLIQVPQRPKLESYPARGELHARVFIVTRMLTMEPVAANSHLMRLHGEQISIFLGRRTVLTFQERPGGDVWEEIRKRLKVKGSKIRQNDASFLVYSLIDAIVDHCFPILEHYSDRLEELEDEVLDRPTKATLQQVHHIKRELLLLRRAVWPMREVVSAFSREETEVLSDTTRTYLRDVYDHTVQIIDMVETYREFAHGLTETYMTSLSNRMNEIMKVLTIITTIFVPLTFLAGVYGMNFHHFPELELPYSYPIFWGVCLSVAIAMIVWFKRRNWL